MSAPTYRLCGVVRAAQERMEDFEGPLDLILNLIAKQRIEIRDIKIAELLAQYLAWLEQMKRMDMEVASEFIAMASHLVYIKSRMLLSLSDDPPEHELDQLMQALEERQRQESFHRVALGRDFLTARAELGRCLYTRPPERPPQNKTYAYIHAPDVLSDALCDLRERIVRRAPPTPAAFTSIVGREPFAVGDMIAILLRRLSKSGDGMLSRLMRLGRGRTEWVVLFLAILELCRNRRLRVRDLDGDYLIGLEEQAEDGHQGA